ncbi:MAG: galactitol-1-phosphate 5-dehydrogenase [Chloroflexi bacterium]|nr:galactitol-1-phosphate 5-dehydrogenase [Chloroflexota bacterium]
MRALMYEGPWQMPLRELPEPSPGPGEVVVAVQAAGICGSDVHGFTGSTGRRTPGIVMGHEFSGTVAALGANVASWAVGDRVVVQPLHRCGSCAMCRSGRGNICQNRTLIGMHVHGAYAEAVNVPQAQLYRLPDDLSYEHGAWAEPLSVALHAVAITPLNLLDTVVVVGAGPIGLLTLQVARRRGAGTIIVTDRNAHRLEVARQLGADLVVNIADDDPIQRVQQATDGLGADVTFEAVGITPTVQQALAVTRVGGTITWIGNSAPEVTLNMQQVVTREITIRGTYGFDREFGQAIDLLRSQQISVTPLIEGIAPLAEGPQIFQQLADGTLESIKVILQP